MPEAATAPHPACPRCAGKRTARTKRKGLMQVLILNRLGKYPWACSDCGHAFLFKSRGKLKRRRRTTGEVHLPPVS